MRVLLIGKGGREHALAWKIAQSELLSELYFWPGNAGMKGLGHYLPLAPEASFAELIAAAQQKKIDFVVSGPEAPLSQGLADAFAAAGIPTFGPIQSVAQLEASKSFAKSVMTKAGIPTAAYVEAHGEAQCRELALGMLEKTGGVVLKASGLAAGKGVFVCRDRAAVENGLKHLFHTEMSEAANTVVIEEILLGRECSYFCFLGDAGLLSLGFAVDYKRLEDGDEGPNTGGMGCYAPVPWLPQNAAELVQSKVVRPLVAALASAGLSYRGCLYVGLMWSEIHGPKVVEFNVRLGDPEAQVLALYDNRDWLAWMAASCGVGGEPVKAKISVAPANVNKAAVTVVMAAKSYPYGSDASDSADLPESLFASSPDATVVTYAANVAASDSGELRTRSGRVLAVSARGIDFTTARAAAYERVREIGAVWRGARWRNDIAGAVDSSVNK